MPYTGTQIMPVEFAVGNVAPAARTNVVYPAFERAAAMIIHTIRFFPQTECVPAVRDDRAVKNDYPCSPTANGKLMIMISVQASVVIMHSQIRKCNIGSIRIDIDNRRTPIGFLVLRRPILSQLCEDNLRTVAVFTNEGYKAFCQVYFFMVQSLADQDDNVVFTIGRHRINRILDARRCCSPVLIR